MRDDTVGVRHVRSPDAQMHDWLRQITQEQLKARNNYVEALMVRAVALQDFDHIDRLHTVFHRPSLGVEYIGVASSLENL